MNDWLTAFEWVWWFVGYGWGPALCRREIQFKEFHSFPFILFASSLFIEEKTSASPIQINLSLFSNFNGMKEKKWMSELPRTKPITHCPLIQSTCWLIEGPANTNQSFLHFIPSNKKDKSFNLISRNKEIHWFVEVELN